MKPHTFAIALLACGMSVVVSAQPAQRSTAPVPGRSSVDPGLEALIAKIRALDNHIHVNSVAPDDSDYDALPLDALPPFAPPVRFRPEDPAWSAAARALYGYRHGDLNEPPVLVSSAPGAPARTIEATVRNGSVRLAATLDLPDGPGPHPVVIALHASGAGERGFPSYRHLAQALPARGIGVVRYDRRGSGASTGDFERASFPDLASDARAVIRWARGLDFVDRRRVALWGMSQAGWIAPLVAAEDPSVAAVVIVSGAGGTPADQMIFSAQTALREAGYPPEIIEKAIRLRRAMDAYYAGTKTREEVARLSASARSEPWYELAYLPPEPPPKVKSTKWYYQFAFDPAASIARVRAPVLLLYAERDPWIPIDQSIAAWKARARTRLTIRRIPGANHFMAGTTDSAHDLDPEPVSGEYTRVMTEWLERTLAHV